MNKLLLIIFLSILTSPILAEGTVDFNKVVTEINIVGDKLIADYQIDNGIDTADEFSDLYFDDFAIYLYLVTLKLS
ncbi:hypothetical protein QUF50_09840, partial [Thiotrichales bacterium HSG1]|nr:hypothetical protein [Thiotrichales bacterium HSG1]